MCGITSSEGVVEERALGLQRQDEVAQAGLSTPLRGEQRGQLCPAGEGAHPLVAPMFPSPLLELRARNEVQNPGENGRRCRQAWFSKGAGIGPLRAHLCGFFARRYTPRP